MTDGRQATSFSDKLKAPWRYVLFPGAGRCLYCGSENGSGGLCEKCRSGLARELCPSFGKDGVVYKYYHEGTARQMILRLKFYGEKEYAGLIAEELAPLLPSAAELLTPVPLHKSRERSRGFNQSELIARELSALTGKAYADTLERIKDTPVQSLHKSHEERIENVRNAFVCVNESLFKGKNVCLVDDVITTGATSRECSRMLLEGGARAVFTIAFSAPHT